MMDYTQKPTGAAITRPAETLHFGTDEVKIEKIDGVVKVTLNGVEITNSNNQEKAEVPYEEVTAKTVISKPSPNVLAPNINFATQTPVESKAPYTLGPPLTGLAAEPDVMLTVPLTDGQFLNYSAVNSMWTNQTLILYGNALSDFNIYDFTNGNVLTYNASNTFWESHPPAQATSVIIGSLPASSFSTTGQQVFNSDYSTLYVYDGTNWLPAVPPFAISNASDFLDNEVFNQSVIAFSVADEKWEPAQLYLNFLVDVIVAPTPNNGDLLTYSASAGHWVNNQPAIQIPVILTTSNPVSAIAGQLIFRSDLGSLFVYTGSAWASVMMAPTPPAISNLTDVAESTLNDGDRLIYNAGSSKWINQQPPQPAITIGTSYPVSPAVGNMVYRSDLGHMFIWDGGSWLLV